MTIEEMKFMESHIVMSRTTYDALRHQIEMYQNYINKVENFCRSKGDGSGLVYTKEILQILGAEPFEEEEEE